MRAQQLGNGLGVEIVVRPLLTVYGVLKTHLLWKVHICYCCFYHFFFHSTPFLTKQNIVTDWLCRQIGPFSVLPRFVTKPNNTASFETLCHFERNYRRKEALTTNHCLCQKTRVIALSCAIKISALHCLVLWQSTRVTNRQTDRQTDRITTSKTALA